MPKSSKKLDPKRKPFQQRDIGKLYLKKCGKKLCDYRQNKYSKYAIQWPFRALIVGPSGSGKNYLLAQLLTCKEYLPPIDKLYIFSNSIDQELYELLDKVHNKIEDEKEEEEQEEEIKDDNEEDERNVILSSDIDSSRELFDRLRERPDKSNQVLVVFDDINQSTQQKKILEDFWCFSRPNNISVILLSQTFSMKIPTIVRTNSTHYVLFKPANKRDIAHIKQNIFYDEINIEDIIMNACTNKYDYLLVNKITSNQEMTFLKNWHIHLKPFVLERMAGK